MNKKLVSIVSPTQKLTAIACSAILLGGLSVFALTAGPLYIPLEKVVYIVAEKVLPLVKTDQISAAHRIIVLDIRVQRVMLALLVGSSLAIAGVCYQTLFRNPLSDPFILGISSGAALGAAICIVSGNTAYLPFWAFGGALFSLCLVSLIGWQTGFFQSTTLLLAGVACGALLNALLSCVIAVFSQQMNTVMFWLLGSLTNYTGSIMVIACTTVAGFVLMMYYARDLDLIALGDESAQHLGVDIAKVRFVLLVGAALVTAVAVSVSGIIGFIGLVIPHMARAIVGPQHRFLLPVSAIWGAVFLMSADLSTRLYLPLAQMPVGVMTALVGSPFFLYILFRLRKQ